MRHQPLFRQLQRRHRLSTLSLAAMLYMLPCGAQTAADSLVIVHAHWQTREVAPGVTGKTCSFDSLYGGAQCVSLVEVSGRYTAGIGVSAAMKPLSLLASSNPDGLEWALFGNEDAGYSQNMGLDEEDYGVSSDAADKAGSIQEATAFLPDYAFADNDTPVGTTVSGIVGSVMVAGVAVLICLAGGFSERGKPRPDKTV